MSGSAISLMAFQPLPFSHFTKADLSEIIKSSFALLTPPSPLVLIEKVELMESFEYAQSYNDFAASN